VVEIQKVNLASAEASVGQEMAPEDQGVDFASTALVTQFIDDEAEFQDEYEQGHPDNYNQEETVKDDSDSDAERHEGNVMYNRTGAKSDYKKPERKTQVIPPCPLCLSKGENQLHWLIKCDTFIGQGFKERHRTFSQLVLCKNCFSSDHKSKSVRNPRNAKLKDVITNIIQCCI
jgi:hypothetical protein